MKVASWRVVGQAVLAAMLAFGAVGFAGCAVSNAGGPSAKVVAPDALYNRLGGEREITKIVDVWVGKLEADAKVKARFVKADLPRMKKEMVLQLCDLSGGPQVYLGKDMKTAHKGMNISEGEWSAYMDDLKASLAELKVGAEERAELLVIYDPMKRDVVGQ